MLLGRYIPGDSVVHRLDSRTKLISAVCFIVIIFLANHWQSFLLLWTFTFLTLYLTGIPLNIYIRGVKPFIWLILFAVLMQILFTGGGEIFFQWGPVTISELGMINGLNAFFRFTLIIFISTVVTLTTKPVELTDAIYFLVKPLKVFRLPVEEISIMLTIALRFIPNLFEETRKIIDAQKARGTEFGKGSVFQQMKTLVPVFLPLFVNSLNRAEDLANAMEARGFRPDMKRSSFRQFHWKWQDSFTIGILVLLTASIILIGLYE